MVNPEWAVGKGGVGDLRTTRMAALGIGTNDNLRLAGNRRSDMELNR
jgi:hypothetical protein